MLNKLRISWFKVSQKGDTYQIAKYPVTYSRVYNLFLTLQTGYQGINNNCFSQVWINSYNTTQVNIGNDGGDGVVFALIIGI